MWSNLAGHLWDTYRSNGFLKGRFSRLRSIYVIVHKKDVKKTVKVQEMECIILVRTEYKFHRNYRSSF
jgi:uncharacterized membrane protein